MKILIEGNVTTFLKNYTLQKLKSSLRVLI